jgi:putative ABC transport system permease protein
VLSGFWIDLRLALREARGHPSYSLTAFAVLAFGLGINTAVFSLLYFTVLKPLPYRQPDQLVAISNRYPQFPHLGTSPLDYLDLRAHREIFSDVGVYHFLDLSRGATEHPEKVNAVAVTESLLDALDVKPLLGRTFTPDEERYRGPHAVILSESYWQSRFGRDPQILTRALQLNGDLYPVIGVMPSSFQFPNDVTEMWMPMAFQPNALAPSARTSRYLRTYARLAPGLNFEQAVARIDQLSREMSQRDPNAYPLDSMGWHFSLNPMARDGDGTLRTWLAILFAAVTCLLMIVCSNVAGLVLVRSTQRQFDLSLRMALGASRFRIARQVFVEVMVISLGAGLAGLLIAKTGIGALVKFGPKYLPSGQPRLEPAVFWFGLALALVTCLICGAYPAWHATRFPTLDALKEGGHQRSTSARKRRLQNGLIIAQVGIATTLLICGALLVRSLIRILDSPPGFDPRNVLTLQLSLPPARYKTPESQAGFYNSVLDQIRRLPGVESASACTLLPFGYGENFNSFEVAGEPKPPVDQFANLNQVSLGFFETMKIPLVRGRAFQSSDRPNSELVTVIDQALASNYLSGEDPIGREVRLPWATYRIIGIAGSVKTASLEQLSRPMIYFSADQAPRTDMSLVIRSRVPQQSIITSVQRIVNRIDKDQPIYDVFPLESRIDRTLRTRRFVASLILTFAASGAILAAIALYGLLSYTIALRRRELGIRVALGADAVAIARLIYRGGFVLVAAGLALGSAGAVVARRYIANQLYGTQFTDGTTWLAVLGIITLTGILACALPALRAARLDPMESLRAE